MKKLLLLIQAIFFILFITTVLITILQLTGYSKVLAWFDDVDPVNSRLEEFDPSFSRLNTLDKLEQYCDSLYKDKIYEDKKLSFEKKYTEISLSVIRKRYYHGYSHYGFENNYMAVLLSKVTVAGYGAIVIPDDLLKYPFAACSQQSIVMMELLKRKGLKTRSVLFDGKISGHFSFEVFYNDAWHFYDPNMEPDDALLYIYNRPAISSLASNPSILLCAYKQYPQELILDVFSKYSYGAINEFPAKKAVFFHQLTKFLSYSAWFFFLTILILVRRRYLRYSSKKYVRNSRIYFPQLETGTPSSYYPGTTAPGA
jgi:hypothetical protein